MRRKDREVTDCGRIKEMIEACRCCRLGFYDGSEVYIVPMDFGYEEYDGKRVFYFHSAKKGRKMELIAKTHAAGFELDTNHELVEGKSACEYTSRYQSVIGTGKVTLVEGEKKKIKALQSIMFHSTGRNDWEFPSAAIENVCVFQLEVEKLSCKEHR